MSELLPRTKLSAPKGGRTSQGTRNAHLDSSAIPEAASASTVPPAPPYSVEEALVMRHVDVEGISIDELVRKTKLPVAKVNALCMTLRLKGRLRYFPGNRVALPRAS